MFLEMLNRRYNPQVPTYKPQMKCFYYSSVISRKGTYIDNKIV